MRTSVYLKNLALLASCAGVFVALACTRPSAEERVELLRAEYDVQLTSFSVEDQPQVLPAEVTPEAGTTTPEPAVEGVAAPPEAAEPQVPTMTNIVLDMLVTTSADDGLAGLTVELEQVGADGKVKLERRLWLDVSQVARGGAAQITHTVEDVDYQEGDGFAVSIRSPVPAAERGAYREFEAGGTDTVGY